MAVQQEFGFQLAGVEEMKRAFDQLPKATGKTVLRNALKKAAVPVQELAQSNAPRGPSGNLARSITIGTKLNQKQYKPRDRVTVYVGSTAPHAHLVEFGTVQRTYPATGKHYQGSDGYWYTAGTEHPTGAMPGSGFMTRTWDASKPAVLKILQQEIWRQLEKAAARLAKKAKKGTLSIRTQREVLRGR